MNLEILGASKSETKLIVQALNDLIQFSKLKRVKNKKKLKSNLTVVFVSDVKMKKLNFDYLGKNKITDVLSFSSPSRDESLFLGEIVFCRTGIKKTAKEWGSTYKQNLQRMLIHGVLHLLGYDHELGEKESHLMFRIQEQILLTLHRAR